jgi:hypothetical protein
LLRAIRRDNYYICIANLLVRSAPTTFHTVGVDDLDSFENFFVGSSLEIISFFQDLGGCMTIEEIAEKFSLYKLCCGRSWHLQACDAVNGTGLTEGLDWLSRQLVASGVHDLG